MANDARGRKPTDHGEAVGFCLRVSIANSALLAQHGSGKSSLHADLGPVAHSLRSTVAGALTAAARHVDTYAEITARDGSQQLTAEQEAAKAEAVRAIGREIEGLAQRSIHQTISVAEFESIRGRLMGLGFVLMPSQVMDVVSSIIDGEP